MTLVIGIIGPPCSGKSLVAESLCEHGGRWINADQIAQGQLDDPEVIETLQGRWGRLVLREDHRIDRGEVARKVFGRDAASRVELRFLESVVHPRVRQQIRRELNEAVDRQAPLAVLDVPLLIESTWDHVCDDVICMEVNETAHAAMARQRGWDSDELMRRQQSQIPLAEKRRRSTASFSNNGSRDDLVAQVATFLASRRPTTAASSPPADGHCLGVPAIW